MSLGLGVSAIGDTWTAYAQNLKKVEQYKAVLEKNKLPIFKNHYHSSEEEFVRKHITNLMCRFETSWDGRPTIAWHISWKKVYPN